MSEASEKDPLSEVDELLHSVIDSQQAVLGRIDLIRNANWDEETASALESMEKEIIRGGKLVHKARRRLRTRGILLQKPLMAID